MFSVLVIAALLFIPESFIHQNSEVVFQNQLEHRSVTGVYLILPNSDSLFTVEMPCIIQSLSSASLQLPWGYVFKVIIETDDSTIYSVQPFLASIEPDTVNVSLSKKEFGGILERVYGVNPVMLRNATSTVIASVQLSGDSLQVANVLGNSLLMPDEYLRIWLNSSTPYRIVATDADGFISEEISVEASPESIYSITNQHFISSGSTQMFTSAGRSFTVINCIANEEITLIEIFDELGYPTQFMDMTANPLGMWDKAVFQSTIPPGFVICTDSHNRSYSLYEADSLTGSYYFDLLSLDFDFSFPGRR